MSRSFLIHFSPEQPLACPRRYSQTARDGEGVEFQAEAAGLLKGMAAPGLPLPSWQPGNHKHPWAKGFEAHLGSSAYRLTKISPLPLLSLLLTERHLPPSGHP